MNKKLLQKLGIVESQNSNSVGLQQLTHTRTGQTLLHQSDMTTRQWEDAVRDFVRRTSIAYIAPEDKPSVPAKKRVKKLKPLKKFGHGGTSPQHGSLSLHIGWLEALVSDEEESCPNWDRDSLQGKRLEKVYDAIQLLYEAAGMSEEDQE
jgi:hypothetical protein